MKSGLRFSGASPARNTISTVFSPEDKSSFGMMMWSLTARNRDGLPPTESETGESAPGVKSNTTGREVSFSAKRTTARPETGSDVAPGIENESS